MVDTIKKLTTKEEVRPRRQIEALQKLGNVFKLNLGEDNSGGEITATTSTTPTTKAAVRKTPRVHGRLTHNNTPGILPTFEGGNKNEILATSKGEKKRETARDQYQLTQTNYYNRLKETTNDDEDMKQEK